MVELIAGLGVTEWALIGTSAYAFLSDVIGLNPKWKSNAVVHVVMNVLGRLGGKK